MDIDLQLLFFLFMITYLTQLKTKLLICSALNYSIESLENNYLFLILFRVLSKHLKNNVLQKLSKHRTPPM